MARPDYEDSIALDTTVPEHTSIFELKRRSHGDTLERMIKLAALTLRFDDEGAERLAKDIVGSDAVHSWLLTLPSVDEYANERIEADEEGWGEPAPPMTREEIRDDLVEKLNRTYDQALRLNDLSSALRALENIANLRGITP